MNMLIPIIVVSSISTAFYFIAKRSRKFKKTLTLNGFEVSESYPKYIENICKEIFDSPIRSGFYYRSRINSEWGADSWIVDIDKGGADAPSCQVLITDKNFTSFPEFALALTDGIPRIGRLFKFFDQLEKPFEKAGFHLLSEFSQPFFQKRKGIVVYAKEEFDMKPVIPPCVLDDLRSGGYRGLAFYKKRIIVWTYAEANPDKLFAIAKGMSECFQVKSSVFKT